MRVLKKNQDYGGVGGKNQNAAAIYSSNRRGNRTGLSQTGGENRSNEEQRGLMKSGDSREGEKETRLGRWQICTKKICNQTINSEETPKTGKI